MVADDPPTHDLDTAARQKDAGNRLYSDGDYAGAQAHYRASLQLCPDDSATAAACYSNLAACALAVDDRDLAIEHCTKALEIDPLYEKVLLRRAKAYEQLNKYSEAVQDMERLSQTVKPGNAFYVQELCRLQSAKSTWEQEQQAEMMGKLKELGNSILGKFGMSLDNFQAVKDPETGSYSINYKQS